MEKKYSIKEDAYLMFVDCTAEEVRKEIDKSNLNTRLNRQRFKNLRQKRDNDWHADRLEVLKLLEKVKTGEITQDVFDENVYIDTRNNYE